MKRSLPFLFALALASTARAAGPNTIELSGTRIHLGDVVPTAPSDLAPLDIGPAPAPGASKLVAQSDILQSVPADRRASVPAPAAVRVVRKTLHLSSPEIDGLTRDALRKSGLPRGATLGAVRAPASVTVPAGYDRVVATLPKPPRRLGAFDTQASIDLYQGTEVVARLAVPVQLILGPEATHADVVKGASVSVVIRRGFVEVSSLATTTTEGDVGDVVQVTIPSTGKSLRAKLVATDRAIVVDGP